MTSAKVRKRASAKALDRGLDILDYLFRVPRAPLSSLAQLTDTPPSTLHRLLTVLESHGYVASHQGTYQLGVKGLLLTSSRESIRLLLEELSSQVGETVNFSLLAHGEMEYVERAVADHPLSFVVSVGSRVPLNCSAIGKAVLMGRPELVDEIELKPVTPRSVTDRAELKAELDVARHHGFTVDEEEFFTGVFCIAVPVFSRNEAVGAVSISGPAARLSREWAFDVAPMLKDLGERVSRLLQ